MHAPAAVARQIAGKAAIANLPASMFRRLSLRHGRSLSAPLTDGRWLSIKGCGWTWGPPWVSLSPKDAELCFGLLDGASARREVAVSHWLRQHSIDCARSIQAIALSDAELQCLGVEPQELTFLNGKAIQPTALLTIMRSPWRLADLWSESHDEASAALHNACGGGSVDSMLRCLAERLATAVAAYQSLGAVNDTLNPENVTVAGEVIDFEWMWVPGIPTPDGAQDERLAERQRKEGYYLAECLMVASSAFGEPLTMQQAARLLMDCVPASSLAGFIHQLKTLAASDKAI